MGLFPLADHQESDVKITVFLVFLTWLMTPWGGGLASVALAEEASAANAIRSAKLSLGYRAVDIQDEARRAAQYSLLDSGATVGLEIKYLDPTHRFMLVGDYLNDADYLLETDFDYRGLIRVNTASEKLIHHLDYFSYDRPDAAAVADPVIFVDRAAGDHPYVKVGIDKVNLKAKLPDYPVHLNLGYWRLQRDGHKQLRYLNENCTACHMESKRQTIDRITEEVTLGLDTHAGYINFAVEQLFREFRDRESIPVDNFGQLNFPFRPAGVYQHDATAESRLTATTFKISTSPSGGFNAAAGYTLGKKENLSDLGTTVTPVESETDFHKASADLTLTPRPEVTLNFRYRMLDQDNSTPAQVMQGGLIDDTQVDVRNNIDLTRASYHGKVSWRPISRLTLMGEFERRDIHRGQTGPVYEDLTDPYYDPYWELPEDEQINRFRVSMIARPLGPSKLKVNGWYELLTSDDPAYGASVEEQHRLYTGITWTPSARFGATANIRLTEGRNSNFTGAGSSDTRDRRQHQEDFTAGLWSQVTEDVNVNLYYGFLRSDLTQDLIFGAEDTAIFDKDVEYRQRVHTLTLSSSWQIWKKLRALFEARYIRSQAFFDPDYLPRTLPGIGFVDASTLRSLTELEIAQKGVGVGFEYALAEGWNCSARFSHDDYEDRNSSDFDGAAQLYLFSVARSW